MDETQITWHEHSVTPEQHAELNGHGGCVVWFTGLSGSGKSTVANCVDAKLFELKQSSFVLDGDNVRHGLNSNLGFSNKDRKENITIK